ncbi:MAG: hypothetical protein B6I18_04350 [Bacteroidetes bacterium 4572_112]|nr:MAG: hypothetical protein B6I18_04350 [Bacteroidetes bacterium 4572_112]
MRIWLIIVLSIIVITKGLSQDNLNLRIVDYGTNKGLAYCNISFIGTKQGSISNSEGYFNINNNTSFDSIRISYIGYKTLKLAIGNIDNGDIIKLHKTEFVLSEFAVHADNDYLYQLLTNIRKKLLKNKIPYTAKVYYGIESQTRNTPLELLECFYNGELVGEHITDLTYKNGRVGLASVDGNYFESFNTAKAISRINILHKSEVYPSLPLQFNKRKLKKLFKLKAYSNNSNIIKIEFTPYNTTEYFSGIIWVDNIKHTLLKLELTANNTSKHPFLPIHNTDKISDVSIKLVKSYNTNEQLSIIDHIYFEYSFVYKSVRGSSMGIANNKSRIIERNISSKGIIRVFDYENTFIIPYFNYPDNLYYGDYYKMSFIPYNDAFWNNNHSIALSKEQKEKLGFFAAEGKLVNYRENNYGNNFLLRATNNKDKETTHFGFYYSFWNKDKRITIKKDLKQNELYNPKKEGLIVKRDLYNIEAQILLDITKVGDSLDFKSYSVFDSYQTFYRLPTDSISNAFINIYFDLYEIERQKMHDNILKSDKKLSTANSIYNESKNNIALITNKYIEEVQLGKNNKEFEKWNKFIFDNLGIDNLKLIHYY